jgi:sugar/nucleoside kinase (ribokinase family)
MPIVTLGDTALDVFVRPDADAAPGTDTPGLVRVAPGGSAANVAVWAARLGASTAFIGAVGDDYAAGFLRADLEREGVIVHLQRLPAATAAVAVLVDGRGERTMIPDRGAALLLAPSMIRESMLPQDCWLHLPAYSLFEAPLADAALHAVDLCRAAGGRVGLDTSSVGPLRSYGRERFLDLLDRVGPDVLFANDGEAAFLSGLDDAEQGSQILQRYAPVVVWKLGAAGALARSDHLVRARGLDVPVLDSTGAGDAFAAAFTVAHAQNAPLETALDRANHLAAAVVQHIGARPRLDLHGTLTTEAQRHRGTEGTRRNRKAHD